MALLFVLPILGLLVMGNFCRILLFGNYKNHSAFSFLEIISVVLIPFVFLATMDFDVPNQCCDDSAVFSPAHRLSVYVLIILCLGAYFYSGIRRSIATPIVEVMINCLLLIGIVLNVFIAVQVKESILWIFGNLPIILILISMLVRNNYFYIDFYQQNNFQPQNIYEQTAWQVLNLNAFQKFPILLFLCVPLLVVFIAFLLLFSQKPDSLIRAFTDTYRHGFSQLDYQCDGVVCDGHYLCTVAAKGHTSFVKPVRDGIRGGKRIVCNRQLLIANAFEELLEEYVPQIHRPIRKLYDRIGNQVDRFYFVFNNKWVCDLTYILMKPLEWLFLIILYLFDRNPENRIAVQYLAKEDRKKIKNLCVRQ